MRSWAVFCLFVSALAHGESDVDYALRVGRSSHTVTVSLTLPDAVSGPAALTDRFPAYIESATGVAVTDIFERWQQPLDH
jgi:hypothetical protein